MAVLQWWRDYATDPADAVYKSTNMMIEVRFSVSVFLLKHSFLGSVCSACLTVHLLLTPGMRTYGEAAARGLRVCALAQTQQETRVRSLFFSSCVLGGGTELYCESCV